MKLVASYFAPTSQLRSQDLPYRFGADEDRMHLDRGFNMNSLIGDAAGAVALCLCMNMVFNVLGELMDGD